METNEATTQPAESSPALESLTGQQYEHWQKTGEILPDKPKTEAPAASDAGKDLEAATDGEETHVETPAESAPAPQQERTKGKNAESRIKQLVAEKKELEERLRQREAAAQPPIQAQPEPPKEAVAPKRPDSADFDTWEKYEAARDQYVEDMAEWKAKAAVRTFQQEQEQRAQMATLQEKLAEARTRYSDYDAVARPALDGILGDQQIHADVKAIIGASPVMPDLLYVMGGKESDLADFIETARRNPIEAIRKAVILEQLVMKELDKPGKSDAAPAPRKVTSAPAPPTEVSARGTQPEDEVEGALKSDDFAAYARAANARDIASRKGR